jgi:hypothetical protein
MMQQQFHLNTYNRRRSSNPKEANNIQDGAIWCYMVLYGAIW